jgi:hypothetical protein
MAWQAFDRTMRHHFAMEEEVLFPAFERTTGMVRGPTMVMRMEHTQMRALLDQIGGAASAGQWEAALDHGDAQFRVTKNPNRPFIVQAAQTRVRAVGTVFLSPVTTDGVVAALAAEPAAVLVGGATDLVLAARTAKVALPPLVWTGKSAPPRKPGRSPPR